MTQNAERIAAAVAEALQWREDGHRIGHLTPDHHQRIRKGVDKALTELDGETVAQREVEPMQDPFIEEGRVIIRAFLRFLEVKGWPDTPKMLKLSREWLTRSYPPAPPQQPAGQLYTVTVDADTGKVVGTTVRPLGTRAPEDA